MRIHTFACTDQPDYHLSISSKYQGNSSPDARVKQFF